MFRQTALIATVLGALSGSLTAQDETSLTLQVATSDAVSVEVGWAGQEITGVRLKEWAEDMGGVLTVRGASGGDRELLLEIQDGRLVIRVGDAGADPPDPVDPVDPVDPDVPAGHLNLTRITFDWATELVTTDPDRKENAGKQADNYDNVADALTGELPEGIDEDLAAELEKVTDVTTAFAVLRDLNRNTIPEGPLRDAWAAFSLRIAQHLENLWPFGIEEASKILRAIADGLDLVE